MGSIPVRVTIFLKWFLTNNRLADIILAVEKTVRREKRRFSLLTFFSRKYKLVLIRARVHPFPFRTRKLSSLLPKILGWRRPGKIGNANTESPVQPDRTLSYSSIAQSVEHAAVNRGVVGSSPTGGARKCGLPPAMTASRSFRISCERSMGL